MQNKPNFLKTKMHASSFMKRTYDEIRPISHQKNKPNSNPISKQSGSNKIMQNEPNLQKTKMNTCTFIERAYDENRVFRCPKNEPNSNPTCSELVEPISQSRIGL